MLDLVLCFVHSFIDILQVNCSVDCIEVVAMTPPLITCVVVCIVFEYNPSVHKEQ